MPLVLVRVVCLVGCGDGDGDGVDLRYVGVGDGLLVEVLCEE